MGRWNMDIYLKRSLEELPKKNASKTIYGFVDLVVYDRCTGKAVDSIVFENTRTRVPIFHPHFIGFINCDGLIEVRGKFGISSQQVPEEYRHSYEFNGLWDLFEEYHKTEELTISGVEDKLLFWTAGISEYEDFGTLGTQQGKWFWLQQSSDDPIVGPKSIASVGYFAPLSGYIDYGYHLSYALVSFANLPETYELAEGRVALIKYSWFVPWNEEIN